MILIGAMLEACADKNTLLLLDEPDAHVHEGRKEELLQMLLGYPQTQIVMTTHSPGLVHKALSEKNAQVIWMRGSNGITDASNEDRLFKEMDKEEFYQFWGAMCAIDRPLALFEGPSDVKYVRKAAELLNVPLDVDFLSAGGSGTATDFLTFLLEMFPRRRMFIFFDHDKAGQDGARVAMDSLTTATPAQIQSVKEKYPGCRDKDAQKILSTQRKTWEKSLSQFNDPKTDDSNYPNVRVCFIPPKNNAAEGGFQIEDYFDDSVIREIVNEKIDEISRSLSHPATINSLPNLNLKDIVKNALKDEKTMRKLTKDNVEGFRVLLDKIRKLAEDIEPD